jgi:DNA-3-methyladenine glycosylase
MKKYRGIVKNDYEMTNGPAKFCLSFKIERSSNGIDLSRNEIFISKKHYYKEFEICQTKRIGITLASEMLLRYYIKENPFVTRHKFNNDCIIIKKEK